MSEKMKVSVLCCTVCILLFGLEAQVKANPLLPFNLSSRAVFQINQNALAGDLITRIKCVPSSEVNEPIRYSLPNSQGMTSFQINETSGVLSIATDAVEILCTNCQLQIRCVAGDILSNVTQILISNVEVNQYSPEFDAAYLSCAVPENISMITKPVIATANASDQDRGDCGIIQYSIQSGNDEGYFHINSSTGEISVISKLNYEHRPSFTLTLQAKNVLCTPQLQNSRLFQAQIDVTNVYDEPPIFSRGSYSAMVNEFDQNPNNRPDIVVQLNCSAQDSLSGPITYERMFMGEPFDIDFHNGQVYIPHDLTLDYEEQDFYELQFKCYDVECPKMFAIVNVSVKIIPVNEYGAVGGRGLNKFVSISQPLGSLIASNVPNSNAMLYIDVTDRDRGDNHGDIYFKFSQNSESVRLFFHLDSSTGNLTLVLSLRYLNCFDLTQILSVPLQACEAHTNSCISVDITLFVNELQSGDCDPSFDQSMYQVQVNESVPAGTILNTFTCQTPGSLNFLNNEQIQLGNEALETIKSLFHILNSTLVLKGSLDYETEIQYNFSIECLDRISNHTATSTVILKVLPSNDIMPKFTQPFYIFTVPNQTLQTIGQVQAFDSDFGYGNSLSYQLHSGDIEYLQVDSFGMISLSHYYDSSVSDKLVAIVEVSDGFYTDQTMVLVNMEGTRRVIGRVGECDKFCIAFAVALIFLILAIMILLIMCVFFALCHRKKQYENVLKVQQSILEKTNSIRRPNHNTESSQGHHYSLTLNETETVPCPMYSVVSTLKSEPTYHYATGRCAGNLEPLPPIPSILCDEAPSKKLSSRSELEEYLEMQSVIQRTVVQTTPSSDPVLTQHYSTGNEEDVGKMVSLLTSENEQRGPVLGAQDGQMNPHHKPSVDNIYEHLF